MIERAESWAMAVAYGWLGGTSRKVPARAGAAAAAATNTKKKSTAAKRGAGDRPLVNCACLRIKRPPAVARAGALRRLSCGATRRPH